MLALPSAEEIATWPPPNYVDPETRRPLVLAIEIPLLLLVVLFVSMRFYSRTILIKALGGVSHLSQFLPLAHVFQDDWFMLAAAVTTVAATAMTMVSTERTYQTGYHLWDLTPEVAANPARTGQVGLPTTSGEVEQALTGNRWLWRRSCSSYQSLHSPKYRSF